MEKIKLNQWQLQRKWERAKMETLEKQKQRREMEPLWYCMLITKYPRRAFGITLGLHLGMAVITGILFGAGYDIIPVYMDDLPVHLHNEPWQARVYAWLERNKFPEHYERISSGAYQTQGSPLGNIDINYESKDGSTIFTKSNMLKMKEIEDRLMGVSGFDKYCRLDIITRDCAPPTSILRYFDSTYANIDPVFNDTQFNNISGVLYTAYSHPDTAVKFKFFLGKDHSITETFSFSPITRSVIQFGFPVKHFEDDELGYRREAGKWTHNEMEPMLEDFKKDNEDILEISYRSQVMWFYFTRSQAFVDCFWAGGSMGFIFIVVLFHTRSLWLAGFAVLSVITSFVITNLIYNLVFRFQYLGFFHVLSLFIILGIGADNFFVFYDTWRNAGIYKYPTIAHRLSDTYRKSSLSMLFTSLTTSVAFYSNAITAILATRSFGVFAGTAVVVNYLSVIIYFPTVVVMYHLYYENFQWPCLSCCKNKCMSEKKGDQERSESTKRLNSGRGEGSFKDSIGDTSNLSKIKYNSEFGSIHEHNMRKSYTQISAENIRNPYTTGESLPRLYTLDGYIIGAPILKGSFGNHEKVGKTGFSVNDSTINGHLNGGHLYGNNGHATYPFGGYLSQLNEAMYSGGQENGPNNTHGSGNGIGRLSEEPASRSNKKKPLMTRFFGEYYFKMITNKFFRWIIILLMAGVLAFFIFQVTKLEADNEEFQVLPDSHVYEVSRVRRLESFVSSYGDETLELYIIWGVKPNDMSGCDFTEPECDGIQVYDDTFDINTPGNQLALKTFCETLENMDGARAEKMRLRKNQFTGKYEIRCFLQNLDNFLEAEPLSTGANLTVPFTKDKVTQFMQDRPQFYNASLFDDGFQDYLEIPTAYWLSDRHTYAITDDFYDYDPLIGEGRHDYSHLVKNYTDKYYGNFIKYVAIEVNTTIKFRVLGYVEGLPILDSWEEFMEEELAKMPDGLKQGFQTDVRFMWHFKKVEKLLVQNAVYGVVIGISLAFPILIIATGNFIVGTLATFSLCCCTVCVIGVIPLGGWKLGYLESLNTCMVVGLSVDYVVHLAQAYSHSLHADRLSRVKDMLEEMGTSVLFGAITSLGAAMFMFFTIITFFNQFAAFMFSTIGFSLLFSLLMFTTLMGILGPQNETGSLRALYRNCKRGSTRKDRKSQRHTPHVPYY